MWGQLSTFGEKLSANLKLDEQLVRTLQDRAVV
jgi:hypothetical protein